MSDKLHSTVDVQQASKRLCKAWEFDLRLKPIQGFIESWNYWREYYRPTAIEYFGAWKPKNSGQLSTIENIIDLCKSETIELDIFIACAHRSFAKAKFPLPLNMACAHGLEYFARHAEDVYAEIDEEEYRRSALEDWDE